MNKINIAPKALAALKESHHWAVMTKKQRCWLEHYLESGSALEATEAVYNCRSERQALIFSYEVPKLKAIKASLTFLDRYGKDSRELLIEETRKQLDASEAGSIAAQKLLSMLAQLQQPTEQPREEEKPEDRAYKIGTLLEQDGVRYRVAAVEVSQ